MGNFFYYYTLKGCPSGKNRWLILEVLRSLGQEFDSLPDEYPDTKWGGRDWSSRASSPEVWVVQSGPIMARL